MIPIAHVLALFYVDAGSVMGDFSACDFVLPR